MVKGIRQYYEAACLINKKFKNVKFDILGFIDENDDGISLSQLLKWKNEGVVRYIGHSENIVNQMLKYDCVVLPTYYNEGVPRVLLEASALRKPIITTKIAGCNDAVEHGVNGFLCNPKDSQDLFLKMKEFLNLSQKSIYQMGLNGRKKMEKEFDEKIVSKLYQCY